MPTPARIRSTIASIVLQPDDLRDLRAFHKALADVNRLRIVRRLADGEASVAELIAHVGLSASRSSAITSSASASAGARRDAPGRARDDLHASGRRPSARSRRASAPSWASPADA